MKEMLECGLRHLTFAFDLCEIQRRNGLYFLLEHPAGASCWSTSPLQRMFEWEGMKTCKGCMCCFDLRQVLKGEEYYVNW